MEIGFLQEIKAIIKSLVLSSPQQISIDKLNKDFKETEGYQIPYGKLGFNSLELFLRSIHDTVKVEGKGNLATLRFVPNRKSDHIHDMIKTQKKTRRKPKASNSYSTSQFQGQNRYYHAPRNFQKREHQVFNMSRYEDKGSLIQFREYHAEMNSALPIECRKLAYTDTNTLNKNYEAVPAELAEDEISEMTDTFEHAVKINSTLNIRSLVSADKEDKSVINKDTSRPTFEKYNASSYNGFSSNSMGATSKKTLPNKSVFNEINMKLPQLNCSAAEKNAKQTSDENEFNLKVAKQQARAKTILKNKLNALPVNKEQEFVTDSPKKLTNLTYQQYDALLNTQQSTSNHKRTEVQQVAESNFFQVSFSSQTKYDDIDEAVPKFAANNLVFRVDFPNNTVMFGQKILPYKLPDDFRKGSIIGIFISEIHNPFKFWFHIHKEDHELDLLMHHIERFYMSLDNDELIIPEACHTPGQICAALYNNLWHRAEIVAQPINKKTKVFFLDYGTVSEVNSENIKYLAMKFADVPSQAIRGSLSHIRPRGLHWSHAATKHFLSLVCELMLYAQVADIDKQNRVLHMVICNTNGPEATQVNKSLVENGFAFYYGEWMEHRIAKNGLRWHHPREDFPTFEMLEAGQYPSLSDVLYLQELGIDYEKIIDGKVFHFGKLNNHENAPDALRNLPFHLLNTNPFKCDIIFELYRSIKLI